MILDELTLRNFGLFEGNQVFLLRPGQKAGQHLPIVLFGGLNGGGKTTLFDAIQLVLYGTRARCSKRANLSYEDFLRQSIHQGVSPALGASIALSFRYRDDGEEHLYEVRRAWKVTEDRLREEVKIFKDGLPDTWLSENWHQLVEDLIPLEISQLFFFDAEKIRNLAEDDSSSQALGSAIKSLLGLDIVERLIVDATALQSRIGKRAVSGPQQAQAGQIEEKAATAQNRLATLLQQRAGLQNELERANEQVRQSQEAFAQAGGKHWEARLGLNRRLGEVTSEIRHLQDNLVALAGGELPIALVQDLLGQVRQQAGRERQANEQEVVQRLLADRDQRLLEALQRANASSRVVKQINQFLTADREDRIPDESIARRLNLSEEAHTYLLGLLSGKIDESRSQAATIVGNLDRLIEERDGLERTLAAAPEDSEIAHIAERLTTTTRDAGALTERTSRLDEEIRLLRIEVEAAERKVRALWEGNIDKQFEREDLQRMVQIAGKSRDVMERFLREAMERKIDRLSQLITESFRFLLRKQSLVERVVINPDSFSISLIDNEGHAIPKQRLSEGEKQLFAIAVLWGLARAAVRPLPAVIDTPMARLDASHRQHLVERYFPNASHQVIILSTDTEVDLRYYELLQPHIARAYHLNYDEGTKRTIGEEGYFWKERASA